MEVEHSLDSIKILSWDGDLFEVPVTFMNYIEILEEMPNLASEVSLEDLEIDSKTLEKIIHFCKNHDFLTSEEYVFPLKSRNLDEILSNEFDRNFIKSLNEEELLNTSLAAHKLGVKSLMSLCCIGISYSFVNMTQSELEPLINYSKLSLEEDEWLRLCEYPWVTSENSLKNE